MEPGKRSKPRRKTSGAIFQALNTTFQVNRSKIAVVGSAVNLAVERGGGWDDSAKVVYMTGIAVSEGREATEG